MPDEYKHAYKHFSFDKSLIAYILLFDHTPHLTLEDMPCSGPLCLCCYCFTSNNFLDKRLVAVPPEETILSRHTQSWMTSLGLQDYPLCIPRNCPKFATYQPIYTKPQTIIRLQMKFIRNFSWNIQLKFSWIRLMYVEVTFIERWTIYLNKRCWGESILSLYNIVF